MPRYPLKLFFRDKKILLPIGLALFWDAIAWLYLGIFVRPRTEAVFLHYTVHFGVDSSGPWFQIFFLPLLGLILLALNFTVAYFIYDRSKNLALLTASATVALELLLLVETFFLISLNF